jgi:hypothetical protein
MLNQAAVTELLELGRTGEDRVPAALADPQAAWSVLQRDPALWDAMAQELSEEQLRFLIRGLVHYSRARGPAAIGLSVSPVIRLFQSYSKRFPDDQFRLTRWIVVNRVNPYEPFGSFDW